MKRHLHPLLLLCLPLVFAACETVEPEPDPELGIAKCKKISQTNSEGYTNKMLYSGENPNPYRLEGYQNEVLLDYMDLTYDDEGRVIERLYTDVEKGTGYYSPVQIFYNADGKWQETRVSYYNSSQTYVSDVTEAEYNNQNQIIKYTSLQEHELNGDTVNFTITYDWTGGNNSLRTLTSPTVKTVTQNEFDLSHENMRRGAQEKLAFNSSWVSHNKNMLKSRTYTYTDLASGVVTITKSEYDWEYDEAGYPAKVVVTSVTGDAEPVVSTTTFEFSCTE